MLLLWVTTLAACASTRPGKLMLRAPLEGAPSDPDGVAARLPGLGSRLHPRTLVELGRRDGGELASARTQMLPLVESISEQLQLDHDMEVILLPGLLRDSNVPEVLSSGVVIFSDDDETTATVRILRGVVLTHPALPPAGTLLADVIRAGLASRFAARELGIEARGSSPFISYDEATLVARLPHLTLLTLHFPQEPRGMYGTGWITREDLDLLGWVATAGLCNLDAFKKEKARLQDIICAPITQNTTLAAYVNARLEEAVEGLQARLEDGSLVPDCLLTYSGGSLGRGQTITITVRNGTGLLRIVRRNIPGPTHVISRLRPKSVLELLANLRQLDLASINPPVNAPVEHTVIYTFRADIGGVKTELTIHDGCGGDEKACTLHRMLHDLASSIENET